MPTAASWWTLVAQWVTQVLPHLPVLPAPTAVLAALHFQCRFQWQAGMWAVTGAGAHALESFTLSPEQMQDAFSPLEQ